MGPGACVVAGHGAQLGGHGRHRLQLCVLRGAHTCVAPVLGGGPGEAAGVPAGDGEELVLGQLPFLKATKKVTGESAARVSTGFSAMSSLAHAWQ